MWGVCRNLRMLGFQHYTINHRRNFVDPENSFIHTQTIERLWRGLKTHINLSMNSFEH